MSTFQAPLNTFTYFVTALVIGALGSAFYFGGLTSKKSGKTITSNDCLVVGLFAAYKPYEFKNEKGGLEGFDIDLSQEIAKRLGKELVIKDIGFDALILSLKKNEIDLIVSDMSITHDRLKEIDMIPYHGKSLTNYALVFWKTIPAGIKTLEDLKNYRNAKGVQEKPVIGVQTGTTQYNFLNKIPYVTVRTFDNVPELLLDIQYNKSAAVLLRHDIVAQFKKDYPGDEIQVVDVPLAPEHCVMGAGIGVHKDTKELTEKVSKIIKDLQDEGFMTWLERKWFSTKAIAA